MAIGGGTGGEARGAGWATRARGAEMNAGARALEDTMGIKMGGGSFRGAAEDWDGASGSGSDGGCEESKRGGGGVDWARGDFRSRVGEGLGDDLASCGCCSELMEARP